MSAKEEDVTQAELLLLLLHFLENRSHWLGDSTNFRPLSWHQRPSGIWHLLGPAKPGEELGSRFVRLETYMSARA